MPEIVLGASDNGRSVSASVGDAVVIKLPENPTTGYRWSAVAAVEGAVTVERDEFLLPSGAGVGGGGVHAFTWRAQRPGTGPIEFVLQRAREGQPTQRFRVTVVVK